METVRKLTLPSGGTCIVRRLTARDSLTLGFIPDTFGDAKVTDDEKAAAKTKQVAVKMSEIILCDCAKRFKKQDGSAFTITRKPFEEIWEDPSQINVDLFSTTEDGEFIVGQVMEMSGFGPAAKEAASPFSDESGSDGVNGRACEALPGSAERPAEARA